MYVLDTDTVGFLHQGHEALVSRIRVVPDWELFTTIVTRIEILRGRFDFLMKAADGPQLLRAQFWLQRSERFLDTLPTLTVTSAVAEEFTKLRNVRGIGKIGLADLLISAIALANEAVIVTRNEKHFAKVPGLKSENWIDG